MMKMSEAIELLKKKVTSKELPPLMKILKPEQVQLAMKVIGNKSEEAGKQFVKSLDKKQEEEIAKIVGSDLLGKLKEAAR